VIPLGPSLLVEGPDVVAIGGGRGLSASLSAVRHYAGKVTAVVSVADDGGSTGRLREAVDRAAPGDLRKCLAALAGYDSLLLAAMEHRFDAGELEGHAFGNLLIAALEETGGDLVKALDEVGRLLGAVGRTLPCTVQPVIFTPRRNACPMPSSPGKLGSKLGCRLMIFPANAFKNPGLMTRMKPASTTKSGCAACTAAMKRTSPSPSSFVLNGAGST
jgi:hypothetical protein